MSNLSEFSKALKRKRLLKDLTKKELAEKCGVSPSSIGKYESGIREPKASTRRKLEEILGTIEEPTMDIPYDEIHVYNEIDLRQSVIKRLDNINVLGLKRISDYLDDIDRIEKYRK